MRRGLGWREMRKGVQDYDPENLKRIRKLRKEMSISEKVLWAHLRKDRLGFSFRRQVPIGVYVMDFYCAEARVDVEVDGEQHDERKHLDQARDEWIGKEGVVTMRIPSLDLFDPTGKSCADWIQRIRALCEARVKR
jgi:very-short-patch-repair endonuclease